MKNLYTLFLFFLFFYLSFPAKLVAQNCHNLSATCFAYESRCAATGAIKINATGGSGNYKYRTIGPVNSNYTSTDSITGLSAGNYTVQVNDLISNCIFTINNVVVSGTYSDPRFTLNKIDVSCDNGSNGSISLSEQTYGLSPFVYSIVAPSPTGVGTTNTNGLFSNLSAGNYFIRLTDSCGGIQTRLITINNYNWNLIENPFVKTSCNEASGYIKVQDSRGNISTITGIPGFMYGIIRSPGDTIWSSSPYFTFSLFSNSFQVIAKDTCGIIKKAPVNVNLDPQVGAIVLITNRGCSTFSAALSGISNFISGRFCLHDSNNNIIGCNSSGNFDNIPYGNYCISAYDTCSDTSITRCFSATPPPISVGNTVLIKNKTCIDFTVSITGQNGLTNPEFCLYDSGHQLIGCNGTGIFNNLPYGNYCIKIRDGCRDTTIIRCFNVLKPIPFIPLITAAYINCNNFGIIVGGDTLSNPQYCLYNSAGILITCNSSGIFDSIPLGTYCVNIYDSCYDTTITRCITVGPPVINNDIIIRITRKTCTTFTLTTSGASLTNALYCLYNTNNILIGCNTTGVFTNLPYGSYCIKARNGCPDTLIIKCFTELPLVPSVNATIKISNNTCTSFTAAVFGQQNLTNPRYCIYDSADNLIECNTRGVFNNIPYGRYCIKIQNTCYDTTITRCFTSLSLPVNLTVTAGKSCENNYAKFTINFLGAVVPVNVKIYKPDGSLFLENSYMNSTIIIDSVRGVTTGQYYKIIASDLCGNKDTAITGAIAGYFEYTTAVTPKCPGATWANGSGNVAMHINTNMGSVTVRIIKKDGITYATPLVPNTVAGGIYTFTDLGPGTYILRSNENICNRFIYDTVNILPYQFPNLNRSSAYQCDQGGFSISAVAHNGVAPFTYQIIGSVPSFPSIISVPQTGPIFNINNGTTYSLIRLRALDACGNATLGDASILPLTSFGMTASYNCLFYPTTLSVDTIFNAQYAWYKKATLSGTDSVYIGSGPGFYIPSVLPSDTGVYICYMDVNGGCIKRTYSFHLNGACYIILPVKLLEFKGKQEKNVHILSWKTIEEKNGLYYILERKTARNVFTEIGRIAAKGSGNFLQYELKDVQPEIGNNFYRLKFQNNDGTFSYSNIVMLQKKKGNINYRLFPNPVKDLLSINLTNNGIQSYDITLFNLMNQPVIQKTVTVFGSEKTIFIRPSTLPAGIYILRIGNNATCEQITERLIFL